jgi:tetratricopeptide (TPR) repeat protein
MNVLKNFKNNLITKHRYFTTFAFVGGAISDIIQPIAPFSLYFLFFFITASLVLFFLRKKNIFLSDYFNYSIIGLLVSLSIFSFQKISNAGENGVLANNFDFVKKFQSDLGIISQDLKLIKKEIVDLNKSNKNIETNTVKIAQGVDELNTNLKKLQSGTSFNIIKDPKSAMDFYSNAKFYELKGDFQKARQSYNKYFSFQLSYVDPHYSYVGFLKIQEGLYGAREIYQAIYLQNKTLINQYVSILLQPTEIKIKELELLISKNINFAPAYLDLAKEYSIEKKGQQSFSDKKNELDYLKKFMNLHNKGFFVKYFIDKLEASKLIAYAESKLQSLKNFEDQKPLDPQSSNVIMLNAMVHNGGITVTFEIIETVREIFYRLDNKKEFTSLGFLDFMNQETGKKMANNMLEVDCPPSARPYVLDCGKVNQTFYIKYIDINQKMQGPYKLNLIGKEALRKSCDQIAKYNQDYIHPGCEEFSSDTEKKYPKAFVFFPPRQPGDLGFDLKEVYLNPENCIKINKFSELKWRITPEAWIIEYCKNN